LRWSERGRNSSAERITTSFASSSTFGQDRGVLGRGAHLAGRLGGGGLVDVVDFELAAHASRLPVSAPAELLVSWSSGIRAVVG